MCEGDDGSVTAAWLWVAAGAILVLLAANDEVLLFVPSMVVKALWIPSRAVLSIRLQLHWIPGCGQTSLLLVTSVLGAIPSIKNVNTVSNHLLVCTNNWLRCPVYDTEQISTVNVTLPSKLQYWQVPNKAVGSQLCHYQTTCLSSSSLKHHTNVYRNTNNIFKFY